MNKSDIVDVIAEETNLKKADVTKMLESFQRVVRDALQKGDEVRLIKFGTFCVTQRKATQGRNPRTGATLNIPAKNVARFKPGKELQDAVAG